MTQAHADVTIVGAGIAGCALAILLSERGKRVRLLEARAHPGVEARGEARSINLALSRRGLNAVERLGLAPILRPLLTPMYGRVVHHGEQARFDRYDLVGRTPIYSVRRRDLLLALLGRLERDDSVQLEFEARCRVDAADLPQVEVQRPGEPAARYGAPVLIGADGLHSPVRAALLAAAGGECSYTDHGLVYKELHVPAACARAAQLERNALHIWPAESALLIALPNPDVSFTATLFLPAELVDPARTSPLALREFVLQHFAPAAPLLPRLEAELAENPAGPIASLTCSHWYHPVGALLLGDAAHAMVPFFGQGMNCALEDCLVLDQLIEEARGELGPALARFPQVRRGDVEAIAALSLENFQEMHSGVRDPRHQLRRACERALQLRHPDRYLPLYAMVSFTALPYGVVRERARAQARISSALLERATRVEQLNIGQAARWVHEWLPALPAHARRAELEALTESP